jgi:hypothetical protein
MQVDLSSISVKTPDECCRYLTVLLLYPLINSRQSNQIDLVRNTVWLLFVFDLCRRCRSTGGCKFFTFVQQSDMCYLKRQSGTEISDETTFNLVSGATLA